MRSNKSNKRDAKPKHLFIKKKGEKMESKPKKLSYEVPYGIDFVLDMDYSHIKRYGIRNGEEDIDCPFCNRKRKAHVSYPKKVYRCNACGESGSLIKLHMKALNLSSTKEAKHDLDKRWESLSKEEKENLKESAKKARELAIEKEKEPMYVGTRNIIYQNLLYLLELKEEDKNDLLRRGLTLEEIERNSYKSYPQGSLVYLAEESFLMAKKQGVGKLEFIKHYADTLPEIPIPGYYTRNGDICLVERKNAGYLVPVRNEYKQIEAFQIRNLLPDDATKEAKESFRKYTWLSSSEKETGIGVRDIEQVHFSGFSLNGGEAPKTVLLTEGCLKADVASSLMKQLGITKDYAPFIAVMGVNSTSHLPKVLKKLKDRGTETIQVCFDMDYKSKEQVESAREKVKELIESTGLVAKMMNWDDKYKGIDDYLLFKYNAK